MRIPIFKAEVSDGLRDALASTSSVAFFSSLKPADEFTVPDSTISKILESTKAENKDQIDLHYFRTILASVGWNKNTDVFDQLETWMARHTPEDKPFNLEHNFGDIIGHMTGSCVLDVDGNVIDDATAVDDLPEKFHIATDVVLYKHLTKGELEERAQKLIEEIAEGKWFVSMEALFHGFDYAIASTDGTCKFVERNEETAFLTKYLRQYGGDGTYEGSTIGRVIKNITFSGNALVKKPANPESVIFLSTESSFSESPVYLRATQSKTMESSKVNEEQLKAKIEELEAKLRENDVKEIQATLSSTKAERDVLQADIEKLQAKLVEVEASKASTETELGEVKAALEADKTKLQEKLVEVEATYKEVKAELDGIKAQKKVSERLSKVKASLKCDEETAKVLSGTMASLSDEDFEKSLETLAKVKPAAAPAPKGTKAAEAADLDNAETTEEVSGTVTDDTDESFKQMQSDIASYFGTEQEEE